MPQFQSLAGRNISPRLGALMRPCLLGAGEFLKTPGPTEATASLDTNSILDSVSYDGDTGAWTVSILGGVTGQTDSRQGAIWTFPLLNEYGVQVTAQQILNAQFNVEVTSAPANQTDLVIAVGICSNGTINTTTTTFIDARIHYDGAAGPTTGSGRYNGTTEGAAYTTANANYVGVNGMVHGRAPSATTTIVGLRSSQVWGFSSANLAIGQLGTAAFNANMTTDAAGGFFFISCFRSSNVAGAAAATFKTGYRLSTSESLVGYD